MATASQRGLTSSCYILMCAGISGEILMGELLIIITAAEVPWGVHFNALRQAR